MPRRLRIAVSVFFALVAVALSALWVRSYWRHDGISAAVTSSEFYGLASNVGTVSAYKGDNAPGYFGGYWEVYSNVVGNSSGKPRLEDSPRYYGKYGFGVARDPTFIVLGVPHWFLMLMASTLAALPWITTPRRFSLRTMLIATTLIAVVLGLGVWLGR